MSNTGTTHQLMTLAPDQSRTKKKTKQKNPSSSPRLELNHELTATGRLEKLEK